MCWQYDVYDVGVMWECHPLHVGTCLFGACCFNTGDLISLVIDNIIIKNMEEELLL